MPVNRKRVLGGYSWECTQTLNQDSTEELADRGEASKVR
jgi:hypothetical protein